MDALKRGKIAEGLDANDVETKVRAAEQIHGESSHEDISWLIQLLKHESFFVRESAAWPLAALAGPTVITDLFAAYQRGFDEGHDNDGFSAALIELACLHPTTTAAKLEEIANSQDGVFRDHAKWLLEFCATQ